MSRTQLAQHLLAIVDPLVAAAASAIARPGDADLGRCQQVWCPFCATAALASGEQHPLTSAVAEHGATLLGVLRAMADADAGEPPSAAAARTAADEPPPAAPWRYESIPVTVTDSPS